MHWRTVQLAGMFEFIRDEPQVDIIMMCLKIADAHYVNDFFQLNYTL